MPLASAPARRFSVHGLEAAPSRNHMVEGASFEDAALQFVEDRHLEGAEDVSLIVEDCETGERQCFHIDLDTGEAEPCTDMPG